MYLFLLCVFKAKLKEQKAVPVVQQEDQQQSNTPLQQLEVAERPVSCEWLRSNKIDLFKLNFKKIYIQTHFDIFELHCNYYF
jgi:hypothetical protein